MEVRSRWGVARVTGVLCAGALGAALAVEITAAAPAATVHTTNTIAPGSLSLSGHINVHKGVAKVHIFCHGFSGATCAGTLELKVDKNRKHPNLHGVIGSKPYSTQAGQKSILRVKLTVAAAGAVSHAKPRLKAVAGVQPTGGAGSSKTVYLYPVK